MITVTGTITIAIFTIRMIIIASITISPGPNACTYANNPCISNTASFHQGHPGDSAGPDGSDGTTYHMTVTQTQPVTQATGRVAYLPCSGSYTRSLILVTRRFVYYQVDTSHPGIGMPSLCIRNVMVYTHCQNDKYVTLFAGAPFHFSR